MALNARVSAVLLAMALLSAACSGSDDAETQTTTSASGLTSTTGAPTTTAPTESTTTSSTLDDVSMEAVLLGGAWSDNVSFDFDRDAYTIVSDGIPSHEIPDEWAVPNDPINISADNATVRSGLVAAQAYAFELPLQPEYSDTPTDTALGTIGIMVSGAALYNPFEGGGGVALDGNFDLGGVFFIDSCNGHPQDRGAYHYHGVPYCITDAVDAEGEHSTMIGVLLDGFPVYGPNDIGGVAATGLDECSGHEGPTPEFPGGIYHYHLTETAPYSITCYHGTVVATNNADDAGDDGPPVDPPDDPGGVDPAQPDLSRAAATLGVSEEELRTALGPPPPDLAAAADALGITLEDLMAALG